MSESVRDMLAREAAEAEDVPTLRNAARLRQHPVSAGADVQQIHLEVYTVRIPVSQLRKLREAADSLNMQPSALIRQWVIERLNAQTRAVSRLSTSPNRWIRAK